jgi:selenocysteine lyase/cysteine desulfurase
MAPLDWNHSQLRPTIRISQQVTMSKHSNNNLTSVDSNVALRVAGAAIAGCLSAYAIYNLNKFFQTVKRNDKLHLTKEGFDLPQLQLPKNITTIQFGAEIREELFYLQRGTLFLNHGSYGAVPRPVMHFYQHLLQRVESHPDLFFRLHCYEMNRSAMKPVAQLLHADLEDCVWVNNATAAVNCVLNSLLLKPGDAILSTDLTYAACKNVMKAVCERSGAEYHEMKFPLPLRSHDQILQLIDSELRAKTNIKFALFDVISSPHGIVFPWREISVLCKKFGVQVMIDGAHGIGQVEIDLSGAEPHYFTTNCHKWLFSPKGSAVLWCNREKQDSLQPNLVSHGYKQGFWQRFWQQATRDYMQFVATTAALQFYQEIGMDKVKKYNSDLVNFAANHAAQHLGTTISPLCSTELQAPFLRLVELPLKFPQAVASHSEKAVYVAETVQNLLTTDYDVVLPCFYWQGKVYVRFSAQIYNTKDDYIEGVRRLKLCLQRLNNED